MNYKKVVTRYLVFVFILLPLQLAQADQTCYLSPKDDNATNILKGMILDPQEARISRARIKVVGGKINCRYESDQTGEFYIFLPKGKYQVTIEATGFEPQIITALKLGKKEIKEMMVHLRLREGKHAS